jgi:peptidoglycan hydrolase-like protein with peptidoglycan-binding domain
VNGITGWRVGRCVEESKTNRLVLCDKGPRVTELQEDLSYLAYVVNVDSYFGKETRTAVNDFERLNRLPINGQVNAETLEAIRSEVRDRGGQPTIP